MFILGLTLTVAGSALSTWAWGKGKRNIELAGRWASVAGLALVLLEAR